MNATHVLIACGIFATLQATVKPALAEVAPVSVQAMRERVDALLAECWQTAGVTPAELASDSEFLRRAHLDLVGSIPKVAEVRAFLTDTRPDKRLRLTDRLLDSPGHVSHSAATWRRILLASSSAQQLEYIPSLENWLHIKLTANAPYDEIVRDLILAEGQIQETGPSLFYAAVGNRPEEMAATSARVFLGVQLECAQCHNHPFDDWRQKDFWGYAAFFARVGPQQPQLAGNVKSAAAGEVMVPGTTEPVPPMYLRGDWADPTQDGNRRQMLARWITSPDNPYFAKATVNRVWANLFGRGLVHPVDDLKATNLPSHPQLLDELARFFVISNFDLWQLHRVLAGTRAYQLSSVPATPDPPPKLFAAMAIKTLTPEQLYDSLATSGLSNRAMNVGTRRMFLNSFRGPPGNVGDYTAGIPQALTLMNGGTTIGITSLDAALLQALSAPFFSDEERLETLFLATVSRPPGAEERARYFAFIAAAASPEDRQRALANILWALCNSAEFTFNH